MSATVRIEPQETKLRQANLLAVSVVCALFIFAAVTLASAADTVRAKRVLIVSTASRLPPGFTVMDRAIVEAMGSNPSNPVDMYAENLDILRFPTDRFQRTFRDYLTEKYAEQPPDLIVLVFIGSLGVAGTLLHEI